MAHSGDQQDHAEQDDPPPLVAQEPNPEGRMYYCDVCLCELNCHRQYVQHIRGHMHETGVIRRNRFIQELFARVDHALETLGGWERCFPCGSVNVQTVIVVECPRCTGAGDQSPSPLGIPGVAFEGGSPRFICMRHAMEVHCRSCSTPLGSEAFRVDRAAIEEYVQTLPAGQGFAG
jgi:hypothetical protein